MSHTNYGLIYSILKTILFPWTSRVRSLRPNLPDVGSLQKEGQLLFVGQAASFIDLLIINELLVGKGFQPIQFTHGLNPFLVMPFHKALRVWARHLFKDEKTRHEMELEEMMEAAAQGKHGFVFLKNRAGWFSSRIYYYQGFYGKVATSLQSETRPVYFIPTSVFLSRMRKQNVKRTFYDVFFRSYDVPGPIRKVYQLFVNYHKGGAVFSRHIDLNRQLESFQGLGEDGIGKRIRWSLLFHLNGEDRAYRGPNKRSRERKVRKIFKERRLTNELEKVAERSGRTYESVLKEAGKNLRDIASDTSERTVNLLRIFFDYFWARTLEGIDVHQEDLDRIRELNKAGPVVFMPCHRSHADYLVVAYLFEKNGLHYPRTAAGDNLAKWPLGPVLRRAGAFFIRRSFKGETIFPLVFDAYLRHLLRERHVLIFFMEGGRSRTGKLLPPKKGMMSMILEAWRQGVVSNLPLVPVTIDYGKVFEGGAYLREKSGQEKQKENLAAVLKSRKVLKAKHGVLRLRFGEPIYLEQYAERQGLTRDQLGFKKRIPFLNNLSYHIMNRINSRVTLTAGNIVAGLLLGTPHRGMTLQELKALFVISVRHLQHRKVELAFPRKKLEIALNNALDTFVQWETLVRVEVSGEEVVNIPEAKRSEMEYYKNNGLHFILDIALFCMAFRCLPQEKHTIDHISTFAREVYLVIEKEFLFTGDYPSKKMMEEAYKALEVSHALKTEDGKVVPGNYPVGHHLVSINAYMLLNFLESYFVVAEVLTGRDDTEPMDNKVLLKQCMAKARLLFAVGLLRRSESLNNVTFQNALSKFTDAGYIQSRKPKGQKNPRISLKPNKAEEFKAAKNQLYTWINTLS